MFKEDPDRAAAIVRFALNLIAIYAGLSSPFIPGAAQTMADAMNVDLDWPDDVRSASERLKGGADFSVPNNLFAKISDEDRDAWAEKFAGSAT